MRMTSKFHPRTLSLSLTPCIICTPDCDCLPVPDCLPASALLFAFTDIVYTLYSIGHYSVVCSDVYRAPSVRRIVLYTIFHSTIYYIHIH